MDKDWVNQAVAICAANNLKLYAWTPDVHVMPEPDLKTGSWLTTHVILVYRGDNGKIKGMGIRISSLNPQAILDALQEAVPHFDEQAVDIQEGDQTAAVLAYYTRRNVTDGYKPKEALKDHKPEG